MDAKQIVRELMSVTGMSQEKLAKVSGMTSQTNVSGILNRGMSLRVDKLDQMISAMGYKIVIMPRNEDIGDGWYEVTTNDDGFVK